MTIAGYGRESTLLSTQDNALEWQVERLKRYGCDRIFIDRMSGASAKRPGYNEMMGLVEAGVITEVVTCSMSRLGRSVIQVQAAIDLFIKKKVKLTALDSSIDLSTAAGRAQVNLQAVFAQLERELIQERVKAGYEGVREQRRAIRAPFGYKLFEGQLRIDPDLEEICRWIRQLRRQLTSATQTCLKSLDRLGESSLGWNAKPCMGISATTDTAQILRFTATITPPCSPHKSGWNSRLHCGLGHGIMALRLIRCDSPSAGLWCALSVAAICR